MMAEGMGQALRSDRIVAAMDGAVDLMQDTRARIVEVASELPPARRIPIMGDIAGGGFLGSFDQAVGTLVEVRNRFVAGDDDAQAAFVRLFRSVHNIAMELVREERLPLGNLFDPTPVVKLIQGDTADFDRVFVAARQELDGIKPVVVAGGAGLALGIVGTIALILALRR